MKRFWIAILRGEFQLVEAATIEQARTLAEPGFEDEQPDELYDLTDAINTLGSRLVSLARERVGDGADSRFRYDVATVLDMWRGADAPDDFRERWAREWQARRNAEAKVSGLEEQLFAAQQQLADVRRSTEL